MTTIQLEAVQLTQIEDDDGRWRRAFSGRITGGQYVAVCDELLNLEVDGKVVQYGPAEVPARRTRIAKQRRRRHSARRRKRWSASAIATKAPEMSALPFHPDARLNAIVAPFATVSVALVLGLLLRRGVNRFLDEGDPRRQLIAQAVLYAGAFIVIAVSMVEAPRVSR